MTFIKNRRAWLKWKREDLGGQEGVIEPKEYPCFAYATVRSFGYEEYAENYLYPADVEKMQKSLTAKTTGMTLGEALKISDIVRRKGKASHCGSDGNGWVHIEILLPAETVFVPGMTSSLRLTKDDLQAQDWEAKSH